MLTCDELASAVHDLGGGGYRRGGVGVGGEGVTEGRNEVRDEVVLSLSLSLSRISLLSLSTVLPPSPPLQPSAPPL